MAAVIAPPSLRRLNGCDYRRRLRPSKAHRMARAHRAEQRLVGWRAVASSGRGSRARARPCGGSCPLQLAVGARILVVGANPS